MSEEKQDGPSDVGDVTSQLRDDNSVLLNTGQKEEG